MNYTIAILDRENHNVASNILWFPETIGGAKKMLSVFMDETRPANADQSARLSRLAKRLLMYFPLESNSEKTSLWNGINPIHTVRDLPWQAWTIQIDSDQSDAFLRRLLPLARELRLDVFDLETETYYCHDILRSYVIPEEKMAMWYELDPIAANPVKYTKAKVAKIFVDRLTLELKKHDFEFTPKTDFPFYFRRNIEGGAQEIWSTFSGALPDLKISIQSNIFSTTLDYWNQRFDSWWLKKPICETEFQMPTRFVGLGELRKLNMRWSNSTSYCRSLEEIDWMVDDLINLLVPLLDFSRTIQGMNHLYLSDKMADSFPQNYHNKNKNGWRCGWWLMFLYAKLAGDTHYETVVNDLMQTALAQQEGYDLARMADRVKFINENVNCISDGPA
jgi:hypothetical protein